MEQLLKLLNINELKFLNTSNRIKQGIINYVYKLIIYLYSFIYEDIYNNIEGHDAIKKLGEKINNVKHIEPFVNNTIYIKFKTLTPTYVTDKPLLYLRQISYFDYDRIEIETNIIGYWNTTERTGNENDTTIKLTNFKIYNPINVPDIKYYENLFNTFKNGNAILYAVAGTGYDIMRPYKTIREGNNMYVLFKINNTTYKIEEPKIV
nr:MAG TPA: hypothetical protein [Crassvirales sp.]